MLADFGVATSRVHTAGLTRAGWTIGTPGFMSPEQARGEPAGPASDVFGLGACLYFALTGESPFGAGSSELLGWRSARGEIAPVPAPVPPPMATLLGAMLDPDPARRPSPAPLRTFEIDHGHAVVDLKRTGPGAWVWALAVAVVAAVLLAGSLLAASPSARKGAGVASATAAAPPAKPTPTTVPPCRPLPYQPCGATLPAAFTDGTRCVGGHGDYDGDPTDGCEAQPDLVDGAELRPGHPLAANLVPADDVDTYRTYVTDHLHRPPDRAAGHDRPARGTPGRRRRRHRPQQRRPAGIGPGRRSQLRPRQLRLADRPGVAGGRPVSGRLPVGAVGRLLGLPFHRFLARLQRYSGQTGQKSG